MKYMPTNRIRQSVRDVRLYSYFVYEYMLYRFLYLFCFAFNLRLSIRYFGASLFSVEFALFSFPFVSSECCRRVTNWLHSIDSLIPNGIKIKARIDNKLPSWILHFCKQQCEEKHSQIQSEYSSITEAETIVLCDMENKNLTNYYESLLRHNKRPKTVSV